MCVYVFSYLFSGQEWGTTDAGGRAKDGHVLFPLGVDVLGTIILFMAQYVS